MKLSLKGILKDIREKYPIITIQIRGKLSYVDLQIGMSITNNKYLGGHYLGYLIFVQIVLTPNNRHPYLQTTSQFFHTIFSCIRS